MQARLVFLLVLWTIGPGCGQKAQREDLLLLATTTSVQNSGLLDVLLSSYASETAVAVRALLSGSGRALRQLENGQADLAITHAPALEAAVLQQHPAWWSRRFMFNEFVLVGPPADPAAVHGARTAEEAMARIARSFRLRTGGPAFQLWPAPSETDRR